MVIGMMAVMAAGPGAARQMVLVGYDVCNHEPEVQNNCCSAGVMQLSSLFRTLLTWVLTGVASISSAG